MKPSCACLLFCLLVACANAAPQQALTLRSQSGQFVVRGYSVGPNHFKNGSTGQLAYVRLDPALFAISCEAIKKALLTELGMRDEWRGSISILLHPNESDNEPIDIASIRFKDRWGYKVSIPERVNRDRLISAMVQVLLMEIANRHASPMLADLPPWLCIGLTEELQLTGLAELTLEPETALLRKQKNPDALRLVRERLRERQALTFNQLSWPEDNFESASEFYSSCAQLFVHELLRLKDGRRCLQNMLAQLPANLNWQTSFLANFRGHFEKLIDVDKWWTLTVVNFQGGQNHFVWNESEMWRQLDDILATPVEVRLNKSDLPMQMEVKLQSIISEWEFTRQEPVLALKLNHLQALRLRCREGYLPLIDGYSNMLGVYLQKRGKLGTAKHGASARNARAAEQEALKKLEELDRQRDKFRPKREPLTNTASATR
ncbi:MAG TPA: hypothetical protein VGE41_06545 [Verrucomicrobiae bacterium]|jgi:hypothetical protein